MKETNKKVVLIQQPQSQLCWATCILMMRRIEKEDISKDITPESIVERCFSRGKDEDNNIGGQDHVITAALEAYVWGSNNVSYVENPISWQAIKQSIDNNQPLLVGYGWKEGGGHVMVIGGYEEKGEGWGLVKLFDPLQNKAIDISSDRLVQGDYDTEIKTGHVGHEWDATWFRK